MKPNQFSVKLIDKNGKWVAKKVKINPEIARWNGHKFKVSSKLVRGFTDLQIKGSSETEDMEKDKDVYVKRKNGQPMEVSMTVNLNAMTGCSVRKEAIAFVEEAKEGKKDYLYIGNKKLVKAKLLLVSANVKEVQIAPGAKWVRADVQLTFKQSGKGGKPVSKSSGSSSSGGGSSGGGGGGGGSAPLPSGGGGSSAPLASASTSSGTGARVNGVGAHALGGGSAAAAKLTTANNVIDYAKKYSAEKKTPTFTNHLLGGVGSDKINDIKNLYGGRGAR